MEAATGARIPFLERTEDLARVQSLLRRVAGGRGGAVVIEGPPGIGKTTLLEAVRSTAGEAGLRVLRARGAELEREFAFGVVRQLFETVIADASDTESAELLGGPAGVAAGLLGLRRTDPAPAEPTIDPTFTVLHGLYWLVANLASERTLCLAVDDLHWADGASLRFLAFLLTRIDELPVGLVIATRPREAGADDDLLSLVTADPAADLIRLAPLTRAGVHEFVESGVGETPDASFVEACLRATNGTPYLLRELVEAFRETGLRPEAAAAAEVEQVGARPVGRSLRSRLRRLPEPAQRLASALAVLEHSELLPAAQLAELTPGAAAEAADLLTEAGFLDGGRPLGFVHPIVRSGVYAELSKAERAVRHRGAARILADLGVGERVAEHLLVSEPAADPWVVEQLAAAARTAARTGAPESAAVFLARAIREPPASSERAALLLELGMAEASAGASGWQGHLEEAIAAAPDDSAGTSAAMALALSLSRAQRFAEAVSVLDRALARLGNADDELRTLLESAAIGAGMNGATTAAAVSSRRDAARRRAAADPAAPPELLAVAAFIAVLGNEPADEGAELALRALAADRGRTSRPWLTFATWFSQTTVSLVWAEQYQHARPLLDASVAQARATGDSARLAVGLAHRAWISLRLGDLHGAEADARTALAAAELPAPVLYRVLNGGILIEALVEQGELAAANDVLAPMIADADTASLTAAVLRFARGRLRVAEGRAADGLADFIGVGELCARGAVTCPSYLPWRSEAALARLALGEKESARALAEEELELAGVFATPRAQGVAQRALGLVVGGVAGESLLRQAVESHDSAGATLERTRALTDLGAQLRRRNRRTEARDLLRESLDSAHRLGARPLAARAETELRATGARPRRVVLTGVEALTASERRVAELASQKLTNREIAQTLFVTARTVEGHLTSVFRKLHLSSRDELAAALAAAD